jgi:DNA-binding beta-propeller fold protein YncE
VRIASGLIPLVLSLIFVSGSPSALPAALPQAQTPAKAQQTPIAPLLSAQDFQRPGTIDLPTSKELTLPVPGHPQATNSFPGALAVSPDGHYAVALNQGYGTLASGGDQSLAVVDLREGRVTDFPESRLPRGAQQSYFIGLQFSLDGRRIYVSVGSITDPEGAKSGDTGNGIAVYSFTAGRIAFEKFWKIPSPPLPTGKTAARLNRDRAPGRLIPDPAGLAVFQSHGRERLVVADDLSDDAIVMDAATGRIVKRFDLSTQKIIPGSYPYGVVVDRAGRRAWVSLWNASEVAELNLRTGRVARLIPVRQPASPVMSGSHPTALLLSPNGDRLFVALANTDEVAEITASAGIVRKFYSTALPGEMLRGAQPVALALDTARDRLYVADAAANAIAVLDVAVTTSQKAAPERWSSRPIGFIPTEWYPSALAIAGDNLLIATAKGEGAGPNPGNVPATTGKNSGHMNLPQPPQQEFQYIMSLLHGSVAGIPLMDVARQLPEWSRQVAANNRPSLPDHQSPFPPGKNPIHHVIYIIRENRTYDQLMGDLQIGNGDPYLTMYGDDITPNAHALARAFGVLDNFYASGEVSGDGHNWSTAAIAGDYVQDTLPVAYRGKERSYDYEGEVADRIPLEDDMPDVGETGTGYIWSDVAAHGLSYRHYGEFVITRWCQRESSDQPPSPSPPQAPRASCAHRAVLPGQPLPAYLGQPHGSPSPWPWPVPMIATDIASKPELRGHFDSRAADFNLMYPDQFRVDEFLNEFSAFVRAKRTGKGTRLPNYILLRLPNDHTAGTRPGAPTPSAAIADNDLALGRVVEAVSHSPYWDDTAILVVEDDAQNGPDHVDAHRTVALLISKYSPSRIEKPVVDSSFYTTVSLVRTLEALLGLPPMNTNDAHAPVIASLFSGNGNHPPFTADYRNLKNGLLYQTNNASAYGAAASARMDFSAADRADSAALNKILWRDRMGTKPMPPSFYRDEGPAFAAAPEKRDGLNEEISSDGFSSTINSPISRAVIGASKIPFR